MFGVVDVEDAGEGRLIGLDRLDAAVVHDKLLEIGEYAQREFCRPGVAAKLEGGGEVVFQVNGGLFCLYEEFARPADAEAVVRGPPTLIESSWITSL